MSELLKRSKNAYRYFRFCWKYNCCNRKGFAIASAALTSLALFAAYVTFTGIDGINIFKVLAMLFIME
jgi:K(+)-stimulated pyrophosphate-energized sodium pump